MPSCARTSRRRSHPASAPTGGCPTARCPHALLEDRKMHADAARALAAARDAAIAVTNAQRRRVRKGLSAGRVLIITGVGGTVAVVASEKLRSKVLDLLFGAEEEFQYTPPPNSAPTNADGRLNRRRGPEPWLASPGRGLSCAQANSLGVRSSIRSRPSGADLPGQRGPHGMGPACHHVHPILEAAAEGQIWIGSARPGMACATPSVDPKLPGLGVAEIPLDGGRPSRRGHRTAGAGRRTATRWPPRWASLIRSEHPGIRPEAGPARAAPAPVPGRRRQPHPQALVGRFRRRADGTRSLRRRSV